ncbi:MAG TPA: methyl-accepting chemotaxis protein [Gammaproteobacteria bacterium]|nr:methyl-accepting chemotaxis protein [Gammaproteobacteria bacterium]
MKLSVQNKLFLGFGSILLVFLFVSINNYIQIRHTTDIQHRLTELREPTVIADLHLMDGVNLSLAGLRGYMILGKDPAKAEIFKAERQRGWAEIDSSLAKLSDFSKNWTDPGNLKRLQEMKALITQFRQAQQEIEDIAHTDANIPAFNILLTEAAPKAEKILAALTTMIEAENELDATSERKQLLKLLADSRGSFAIGLANIRAYLLSGDTRFRDNYHNRWQVNQARFNAIKGMTKLLSGKQRKAWKSYQRFRSEFSPLPEKMFSLRSAPDWNQANHWLGSKAAPKARAIMKILADMRGSQHMLAENDIKRLDETSSRMLLLMELGTALALVLGIVVAYKLSHSITRPLKLVVHRAKTIAEGDLSHKPLQVTGHDELGELTTAINQMSGNLNGLISHVAQSAGELASASTQLLSVAEKTSKGMENQQNETQNVATAMNQMSATVQEVANNASEAASSTREADSKADEGKTVVDGNKENIHQLARGISNASELINKLGEDTNGVDAIVAVINSIAEQTNLLALNAAIEAARAGEQGRGFAVVADEVRTLAARTQESTEEIRSVLESLKKGAEEAIGAMDEGQKMAESSVERAIAASESLDAISEAVASINSMNSQIAAASKEQSAVTEEMNRSIIRISDEAEATLQNTFETSSAVKQVGDLAVALTGIIGKFKT